MYTGLLAPLVTDPFVALRVIGTGSFNEPGDPSAVSQKEQHCGAKNEYLQSSKEMSEASPPSRAGLPGKEDCHFCIAPLDPALPDGACAEQAGQAKKQAHVFLPPDFQLSILFRSPKDSGEYGVDMP